MERLCSGNVRTNRLSALAQAADSLAKAAATLSEAARAAAETLSSELLEISSILSLVPEEKNGWVPNDNEREVDECTNPDDSDYYLSDDGGEEPFRSSQAQSTLNNIHHDVVEPCSAGPMTIDQLRFDSTRPPPAAPVTTEVETIAGLAYRILVDTEADVLLFVCALIQKRQKVICYMNCSIPTFHMYKKFISDVTAVNVYTITKITTSEITEVGRKFLEADRSILLLPETTTPSIEIDEIDSWVIHVGWPSDEQRYGEQRLIHQAQNSIIVACSEDEELYPAAAAVVWQSQPWPGDVDSFRMLVALLRPVFDHKLASIPEEMKAKVYPDWISCHGPRGHRHVQSWDAVTLVKRANLFLLDVLKYKTPTGSDPQASLPEVSEGFMAHNGLELAMKEGVLRVKVPGSGLNHASSLPKTDWTASTSENALGSPSTSARSKSGDPLNSDARSTNRQDYGDNAWETSKGYSRRIPLDGFRPRFSTVASSSGRNTFKQTLGPTYFIIKEEFEAIPLMCFLANTCAPSLRKAVLFFDISGCQTQYRTLIERITGWRVFVPEDAENSQSNEDAASHFTKCQEPAILLLPCNFKISSPPASLKNVSLGYCVYWGSTLVNFVPLLQAKKHQTLLKCKYMSLIMTTTQVDKMTSTLTKSDFKVHPSSPDLLHRSDSPWLSDLRIATRLALSADSKLVKELYESHLRSLVKNSSSVGAVDVANRINKFTANVLLAGEGTDGSDKYPPISGRLVTPLSLVNEFNLRAAVNTGLLYVW
ncbi:unnamed protein product [Rhizoctonia solani]|uniref:Uncharacterized protein n=1 Tax=Rhizoctonia solani TaxID=456999 RepID=A0A8H2X4N5_9AGAM|nr:unnamed protein product [Rhizoctonia solani]